MVVIGTLTIAGLLLAADDQRPIASFDGLGTALAACVRGGAPTPGSELVIRFTLSARGAIVGSPTVVVARAVASTAAQRDLRATVLDAIRRCTPFTLAPDFARAVTGRPLTLRVLTGGKAILV